MNYEDFKRTSVYDRIDPSVEHYDDVVEDIKVDPRRNVVLYLFRDGSRASICPAQTHLVYWGGSQNPRYNQENVLVFERFSQLIQHVRAVVKEQAI